MLDAATLDGALDLLSSILGLLAVALGGHALWTGRAMAGVPGWPYLNHYILARHMVDPSVRPRVFGPWSARIVGLVLIAVGLFAVWVTLSRLSG